MCTPPSEPPERSHERRVDEGTGNARGDGDVLPRDEVGVDVLDDHARARKSFRAGRAPARGGRRRGLNVIERLMGAVTNSAATGSKTTALAPLNIMLALCLGGMLMAVGTRAPEPVIWIFGMFCVSAMALECGAYVFLLVRDRDALRSKRFMLERMHIEKGLIGDSLAGFKEVRQGDTMSALSDTTPTSGQQSV